MILIVDDQKDIGASLERLLRYAGHEAVSVTGGAEALAMLHIRKPALLVLDVNMPEMDGLAVLKTIKEHEGLKDVRIARYSADTQPETMAEAKRLGALDFLVKGTIGFDKLVERICKLAGEPKIADSFRDIPDDRVQLVLAAAESRCESMPVENKGMTERPQTE